VRLSQSGSVIDFLISPDRQFALHRVDPPGGSFSLDLYSARTDGSGLPVRLNATLPAGNSVAFYGVSADGTRAVYQVTNTLFSPFSLHSIPIAGGVAPTLLTSNAKSWITLGGGSRVAFVRGNVPGDELFSVAISGSSAPLELAPTLGGYFENLRLTPDGSRLLFRAGNINLEPSRLYSTPSASAAPVLLSGTVPNPSAPKISPDGTWAVFSVINPGELYSAHVDGTLGPLSLSGPMVVGGGVRDSGGEPVALISPDSSRVVYVADQEVDDVFELYSVPIDGSAAPAKLNGLLPNGGDVPGIDSLEITADGTRVLYLADQEVDEVFELYVVPIDASAAPLKLSAVLNAETNVGLYPGVGADRARAFSCSADSRFVVYGTETRFESFERQHEIFVVPIDRSSEPVRLHGDLAPDADSTPGGIERFALTADSKRVVFSGTLRYRVTELFSAFLNTRSFRGHLGTPKDGDL
jgi:Tol biopolymer transport system component